jgi:hypothetical protein
VEGGPTGDELTKLGLQFGGGIRLDGGIAFNGVGGHAPSASLGKLGEDLHGMSAMRGHARPGGHDL